jgi:hypothetical protein
MCVIRVASLGRPRRWLALILASILAWAVSADRPSAASATQIFYCQSGGVGFGLAPFATCLGPRHSITYNQVAMHPYTSCAGAFLSYPDQFYGSYSCCEIAYCITDHPYSGANVLYPAAHNHVNGSQNITPAYTFEEY